METDFWVLASMLQYGPLFLYVIWMVQLVCKWFTIYTSIWHWNPILTQKASVEFMCWFDSVVLFGNRYIFRAGFYTIKLDFPQMPFFYLRYLVHEGSTAKSLNSVILVIVGLLLF